MKPSRYQEAVFEYLDLPTGNGVIQAVAGSGKTTTLRLSASRLPSKVKVVCFNKEVALELGRKMPPNADCATLHSVGLRAWGSGRTESTVSRTDTAGDKTKRITKWMQENGRIPRWVQPGKIGKVVGLAKNEGIVPEGTPSMEGLLPDTPETWSNLFDHHNVETDERLPADLLVSICRDVLRESIKWAPKILDFDDMLYMPTLTHGCTFPKFPWVFVDELQDVSGLQREMVLRMVESGGRFLGVGDRSQAIYGWRGADVDSMDKIRDRTKAVELPLSICYRCPNKVIELAQTIVPQIEAAEGAEDGLVEYLDKFKAEQIAAGDLIICRNRAPMTKLAYKLLGQGTKLRILGNSANKGLISFIESMQETFCDDLLAAVDRKTSRDVARAQKCDDEAAVDAALDRQETVVALVEGSKAETVDQLLAHCRDLFEGPTEGRTLVGTIHSVKGLEADNVWFLDRDLIPSRGAKKEWQKVQENNLLYVGITRARKTLRFIRSEGLR